MMEQPLTHVYHISDLHLSFKNFENSEHSFGVIFEAIRSDPTPNKVLVIAGDVFHNKNRIEKDVLEFFNRVIAPFKDCPVLIIPGNHDMNPNRKSDDHHLVSVVCEHIPHITTVRVPTIITIGTVDFYCFPNGTRASDLKLIDSGRRRFAVVHETLTGSTTSLGEVLVGVSVADYKEFDAVLLGDIHKLQCVDRAGKMWYPGSFTQVDINEGCDHGYLLWNSRTLDVKYCSIQQPVIDIYVRARCNEIVGELYVPSPNQRIRRSELSYDRCSAEFLESISAKCRDLYGKIHSNNNTKIRNITMNELTDSFANLDLERIIHSAVVKISSENSIISADNIHDVMREYGSTYSPARRPAFKLNYMEWGNLYCYGSSNHINFEDLGIITGISGDNGCGKSSIFSIIREVLFKCVKLKPCQDRGIINTRSTKAFVNVTIMSGNEEIVLKCSYNTSKNGIATHEVFAHGTNISGPTMIDEAKLMDSIIGAKNNFDHINYIDGRVDLSIIGFAAGNKSLMSIFGLDYLTKMASAISKDLRKMNDQKKALDARLNECGEQRLRVKRSDVSDLKRQLESIREQQEAISKQIQLLDGDKYELMNISSMPFNVQEIEVDPIEFLKLRTYEVSKIVPGNIKFYPEIGFKIPEMEYQALFEGYEVTELDQEERKTIPDGFDPLSNAVDFTEEMKREYNILKQSSEVIAAIDPDLMTRPTKPILYDVQDLLQPVEVLLPNEPTRPIDNRPMRPTPPAITRPTNIVPCENPQFQIELKYEDPTYISSIKPNYDTEMNEKRYKDLTPVHKPTPIDILQRPFIAELEVDIVELQHPGPPVVEPINPYPELVAPLEEPISVPCPRTYNFTINYTLEVAPVEPVKVNHPGFLENEVLPEEKIAELEKSLICYDAIMDLKMSFGTRCLSCKSNRATIEKLSSISIDFIQLNRDRLIKMEAYLRYLVEKEKYDKQRAAYDEYQEQKVQHDNYKKQLLEYNKYMVDAALYKYKLELERYSKYQNHLKQHILFERKKVYVAQQQKFDLYQEDLRKYTEYERQLKYNYDWQKYDQELVGFKEYTQLTEAQKRYNQYIADLEAVKLYCKYDNDMEHFNEMDAAYHAEMDLYNISYVQYRQDKLLYDQYVSQLHAFQTDQIHKTMNSRLLQEYKYAIDEFDIKKATMVELYKKKQIMVQLNNDYINYIGRLNTDHNMKLDRNAAIRNNMLHHNMLTLAGNFHKYKIEMMESIRTKTSLIERQTQLNVDCENVSMELGAAINNEDNYTNLSSQIKEYTEQITNINPGITKRNDFMMIFGDKKAGTTMIIRDMLGVIVNSMNDLAERYDIPICISLDSKIDTTKLNLKMGNNSVPLTSASKGQKFMADLLFRISIIDLQPSPCLKMLIIDESLDCLSDTNKEKVWVILQSLGFPVFIVSHTESIQSMISSTIKIDQKGADSKVHFGTEEKICLQKNSKLIPGTEKDTEDGLIDPLLVAGNADEYEIKDGVVWCKICKKTTNDMQKVKGQTTHSSTDRHIKAALKLKERT